MNIQHGNLEYLFYYTKNPMSHIQNFLLSLCKKHFVKFSSLSEFLASTRFLFSTNSETFLKNLDHSLDHSHRFCHPFLRQLTLILCAEMCGESYNLKKKTLNRDNGGKFDYCACAKQNCACAQ